MTTVLRQLPSSDVSVISSLVPEQYDQIVATYPATDTEVYTYSFKGATVATVTVLYTDSTKAVLTSVTRT
jgi:hypothetical protein